MWCALAAHASSNCCSWGAGGLYSRVATAHSTLLMSCPYRNGARAAASDTSAARHADPGDSRSLASDHSAMHSSWLFMAGARCASSHVHARSHARSAGGRPALASAHSTLDSSCSLNDLGCERAMTSCVKRLLSRPSRLSAHAVLAISRCPNSGSSASANSLSSQAAASRSLRSVRCMPCSTLPPPLPLALVTILAVWWSRAEMLTALNTSEYWQNTSNPASHVVVALILDVMRALACWLRLTSCSLSVGASGA
mmetsp:Transcript_4057/g.10123  ORF Transcript_4057/g.10123 Transcript_4057/m.10123 type:complete len:254 (-) Transcript_4057:330-1091(-)